MKIAIVGSRDYQDLEGVRRYVNSLPDGTVILSGATRGVDQTAKASAKARGLAALIFPPDWEPHDWQSEERWNRVIIKRADRVAVFWNGRSRGAQFLIELAQEMGKPLEVYIAGQSLDGEEVGVISRAK